MTSFLRFSTGIATCVLLAACGGGGSEPAADNRESAAALTNARSGELVTQVRGLLRKRLDLRALQPDLLIDRVVGAPLVVAASGAADAAVAAAPSFSSTTVQEAGVDEADVLKTDGRTLYALDDYSQRQRPSRSTTQIRVARAGADGSVTPLQDLPLTKEDSWPVARGLLMAASAPRLVALSEQLTPVAMPQPCPTGAACDASSMIWAPTAMRSHVQVQVADIQTDGTLNLSRRVDIEGRLVNSRRVGNIVYLLTTHTPRLAADQLPSNATAAQRDAALAALSAAELLPRVRTDGGNWQPLLSETDCLVQPAATSASITLTTLVAIDLGSPTLQRGARCFLGGTEAIYMSPSNLYLATTRSPEVVTLPDGRLQYPLNFTTDIHKFAFSGLSISYRASGEVTGHLGWDPQRMALRLSESNGDLRVLSFTGGSGWANLNDANNSAAPSPSPASLTVLRESSTARVLDTLAQLPNSNRPSRLGKPGEQIYGVRFDADRAYLVTFRQTDPLYVLDLSNPADPRMAGELEIPGFSDTLMPLGDGLLFGVGRDASSTGQVLGVKLALFDVRDPAKPSLIRAQTFGARASSTGLDFSTHGLNVFRANNKVRLALPMSVRATDYGQEAEHGLFRFDVDPATRSWTSRSTLLAPQPDNNWDLAGDRSVQIGNAVFYLTQGRLLGAPW